MKQVPPSFLCSQKVPARYPLSLSSVYPHTSQWIKREKKVLQTSKAASGPLRLKKTTVILDFDAHSAAFQNYTFFRF